MAEGVVVMLRSDEGEVVEAPLEALRMSNKIRNLVQSAGTRDPIPVPFVSAQALQLLVQFCSHHHQEEAAAAGHTPWDADFMQIPLSKTLELMSAAKHLDMPSLLDLTKRKLEEAMCQPPIGVVG